jgi:tRNA(fMet)-specific endonuclease VapC
VTSVLDTTAFSAAMRQDGSMVEFLRSRKPGDVATVPPVVAEIEYGIRRMGSSSRKRLLLEAARDRLLAVIVVLAWTPEASVSFGSIKAALERSGEPIDDFDIAIAAIATAHGAEVITANLPHFRRVEGLASRHWADSTPGPDA